ncbi:MAG: aspartate/glutamate racemase family protein [Bacteroidota bacterium]
MKTIGIIGGLTWLSTLEYYKLLNEMVQERLGGVASAKILMYSVNFEEIKTLTLADNWEGITIFISDAAKRLEQAGADCLLLGANTMHKVADDVQKEIAIPLVHIAEATALTISTQGLKKVALLGTRYTMELPFYKEKLREKGIETIIPIAKDVAFINNAIYEEMSRNLFLRETKERFLQIIEKLVQQGAAGVVMGCTEIPILLKDETAAIPMFDTTFIHAKAAVDFALSS